MNAAFDVGADDGFHGILFAFMNPEINVYAFEPIKGSKKNIVKNLNKVEIFFDRKIKNYEIVNCAISDFNGYSQFYETNYKVASSILKPRKRLNKFWKNSKDFLINTVSEGIKLKKKYKVKVITLEKFCREKSIDIIYYLHIDAQGNDLRVIKSLKNYKKYLIEGVAETSKNNKLGMYDKEQSFIDLKKNFKKWNFKITKVELVQKNFPSYNVYFETNHKNNLLKYKNVFIHPSKRIERLFKRIFLNKNNMKDFIYLFLWRIKNYFN